MGRNWVGVIALLDRPALDRLQPLARGTKRPRWQDVAMWLCLQENDLWTNDALKAY